MKILLIAYACEPGRGSEPGVGWQWAGTLSRLGHDVTVITRANNRAAIESAWQGAGRFVYFDLPAPILRVKRRIGVHGYYALWIAKATSLVRRLTEAENFDVTIHVTFGVFRYGSPAYASAAPFVFGPVGGGESTPWRLRFTYPLRGIVVDFVRDLANVAGRLNPVFRATTKRAGLILCKTKETLNLLPIEVRSRARVHLEIGAPAIEVDQPRSGRGRRLLFVGRLLYWKGAHLAIDAARQAFTRDAAITLTIVGDGTDRSWLERHGQPSALPIEWIRAVPHAAMSALYARHDVLLFPSLHDSSGNVVLEAMASAMPVICLDLGGPGEIVTDSCGIRCPATRSSYSEVVAELAEAIRKMSDAVSYTRMSGAALTRARELSWEHAVKGAIDWLGAKT